VFAVRFEGGTVAIDGRALAPLDLEHVDLEAEPLAHVDPKMGELPEARRQHAITGIQAVGERRLPAAGPGRGEQDRRATRGLEYFLEVREAAQCQLGKLARAVVLHLHGHRAQDSIRNVARPRDEEKVATGHKFSFLLP